MEDDKYASRFNTSLGSSDEAKFQKWLSRRSAELGRDLSKDLYDYDVRGYWKSGGYKDSGPASHGTDKFKKPNHPTFSNESIYHGGQFLGGQWTDGGFVMGKANRDIWGPERLRQYMQKYEPGLKLIDPVQDLIDELTRAPKAK